MIGKSMRKNNLYLISASAAMLLILMGTAVAETYDVQNVQFGQNELGYYKLIELNGNRQMVGYGTDLDKSVVDAANIGNAIFDIDLLKNSYASEVLIDAGDKYIVATGEELELNEGYVVAVQQVDIDGNKALIELIKDGKVVDTKLLYLEDFGNTYVYNMQDFGGYNNVPTIIVRMANVHRGTDTNVVTFDGIFQISESLTPVGVPVSIVADETYQETNAPIPNSKPNQEENPNDTDFIKFGIFFIIAIIILLRVLVGKMQSTNEQNKTITSSSISGKSSTVPIITTASGDSGELNSVSANVNLASVESRFISRISDAFVILVMGVIIDVVLGGILYRDELNFMHILFAGVYYTYYFGQGQTLGMKMMDIKLCRTDGSYQIGYGQGLLRWIGTYISLFAIGLGYLWILIDENKQGWHDKMADTYVVNE